MAADLSTRDVRHGTGVFEPSSLKIGGRSCRGGAFVVNDEEIICHGLSLSDFDSPRVDLEIGG